MKYKWVIYVILKLLVFISAELPSKLFDLPSLIISVEQPYLMRNQTNNITCLLSAGWSGASLADVTWVKDGTSIKLYPKHHEIFQQDGNILTIMGGKRHSEGDYQCISEVRNLSLSNKQIIDTMLTSSPVKLKRARLTGFEKTTEYMVSARKGEIARLPCIGIPDVIPGPPEICFEKDGIQGCFGEREFDDEFLMTTTGMQIVNVLPHHSGNYYCVVRNEFTKTTRRSRKPVILAVSPEEQLKEDVLNSVPELVYPSKPSTLSKPIDYDVVAGQDVLLECVISNAKTSWIKHDYNDTVIESNEDSRVQQFWGNLRIRYVRPDDSGLYSCHGISLTRNGTDDKDYENFDDDHPAVYFNLVVHEPTRVQMTLTENPYENSWELFCNASNMKFEIPMIYVNGSNLLEIIPSMGIALETNFFTNPIKITLRPNKNFSGSVQCISRPAMDEAEIYGTDMERGSSRNFFVSSSRLNKGDLIIEGPQNTTVLIGESALLICNTTRVKSRYWKKNDSYVRVYESNGRASIIGSHTLHIKNVQISDEGWYTCIVTGEGNLENSAKAYLKVVTSTTEAPEVTTTSEPLEYKITVRNLFAWSEDNNLLLLKWVVDALPPALETISGQRIERQEEDNASGNWTISRLLDPDVRQTNIENLQPLKRYRFRLVILRHNFPPIYSEPSEYSSIDPQAGKPLVLRLKRIEPTIVYARWIYQATTASEKANSYILSYWITKDNVILANIGGTEAEAQIESLDPDHTYNFQIRALTQNGKSVLSEPVKADPLKNQYSCGVITCTSLYHALFAILVSSISLFGLFILFKKLSQTPTKKIMRMLDTECNGKFFDTSFTIYREHKASESGLEKDRHSLATTCLVHDMVNEQTPLNQDVMESTNWSQRDIDDVNYINREEVDYLMNKQRSYSSSEAFSDFKC